MNYYQHHIGDFNNATRHLSRLERSIYRDLLDLYYDLEKPLQLDFDKLARRIMVEDGERGAMRDVLNEFFVLQDDGYHNARADREIASFQRMAIGGKMGAAKRWAKGSDSPPIATPLPPQAKANANHEPVTMNHEPLVTQGKPAKRKTRLPENFEPNETGVEMANKAGLNVRSELAKFVNHHTANGTLFLDWQAAFRTWIGKAQSYAPRGYQNADVARQTVPAKPGPDPMQAVFAERDRKAAPIPQAIREQMAKLTNMVKQ